MSDRVDCVDGALSVSFVALQGGVDVIARNNQRLIFFRKKINNDYRLIPRSTWPTATEN